MTPFCGHEPAGVILSEAKDLEEYAVALATEN